MVTAEGQNFSIRETENLIFFVVRLIFISLMNTKSCIYLTHTKKNQIFCGNESENLPYFIFRCETMNSIRASILVDIEQEYRYLSEDIFDTHGIDY